MSILVRLGIYLALAAALGAGYAYFVHVQREIGRVDGAKSQATLDDKIISAQKTRIETLATDLAKRDQALATRGAELAACVDATKAQSGGVQAVKAESERLQKSARDLARARQDNAALTAEVASLRAYAHTPPPVDRSCADTLKATDDILRRITGK
jgi:uncharacterized protein (DUF3084 family)